MQAVPAPSLTSNSATNPSGLTIRPFHQAGNVVSMHEFTKNAFNHDHGIQSVERFGYGTDPDGDGFSNEMTRADMTAVAVFQATMAIPGRVIPEDPEVEAAVLVGGRAVHLHRLRGLPHSEPRAEGTTNTIVDETGTPKLWPPTRFTSITRSGQQLTLNWTGSALLYQVQRTTTLTQPQWQNLGSPIAGRTFSSLMEGKAAFFRVMVLFP